MVIWIGFGLADPGLLSADHIQNILTQMAIIAIMACGMVFVIVTGGIDLSVGYGAGFVSVVAAALLYYDIVAKPLAALFPAMAPGTLEVVTAVVTVAALHAASASSSACSRAPSSPTWRCRPSSPPWAACSSSSPASCS